MFHQSYVHVDDLFVCLMVCLCAGCLHPREVRRHGKHPLHHCGAGHHLQTAGRDGPAARGTSGQVSEGNPAVIIN